MIKKPAKITPLIIVITLGVVAIILFSLSFNSRDTTSGNFEIILAATCAVAALVVMESKFK